MPYAPAMITVGLVYWTVDIVSPALPAIRDHFGLTAAGAGLVFSLMFLGRLAGNIPATWLLGRIGAPAIAMAGAFILMAGSLMVAAAPGTAMLYGGRVVQGAGISLVANAALRSILRSRPAEGAAMTWFGIGSTVGGILGLTASGILTEQIGWRAVFVFSASLAATIVGLTAISMVRSKQVVEEAEGNAEQSQSGSLSLRQIAMPLFVNFLVFANYSIWVVLPLYVQKRFDASAERVATLLMVITAVHLAAALPVARVIRRTGSRWVLIAGMVLTLIGTILVPVMPDLRWLVIPLVLYGVGQLAAVNAGGDIVLRRGEGTSQAIGLVRLSSDFGLVIGPIAAGALADWLGYRAPFVALPLMMAVAILIVAIPSSRTPGERGP
jgi:MFS family permease